MLLPFTDRLSVTWKFDPEMAMFADGHYSRQKAGSGQFMPPGETLIIRNNDGTVLFGWLYQIKRDDGQVGINCSIFCNTSNRRSSDVIFECEELARNKWGGQRLFTYIDPRKLRTLKRHGVEFCRWPAGRCFLEAGWKFSTNTDGSLYRSTRGLFLLEKN